MKKKLFIGSSVESLYISYALQENLERYFECTVWDQNVFKPSKYALESLEETLDIFDYGIFVFSPDDRITIRNSDFNSVRDNVIFELGLYIGRLGRENTFFIVPRGYSEDFHLPSDLAGITSLCYDADRSDRDINAALGPACSKIIKLINDNEDSFALCTRNRYDILNNRYPLRRSIRYLDTVCVFESRTSFDSCVGVHRLFSQAKEIKAIGISLNSLVLNLGTKDLLNIVVNNNTRLKLLFLDPDSVSTKQREINESLLEGTIAQITRTNINLIKKVEKELGTNQDNLLYRVYDKVPYINMYIIDNRIIILQHYISGERGQDAPVFVIRDENLDRGLFSTYLSLFERVWEESKDA